MAIALHHELGNLFRVEITGLLQKADLEQCERDLGAEIARLGAVRILFVLSGFQGWEPHPRWNDLTFYVRYGDAIERIAIVGPEQWKNQALLFANVDLRRAPVEFFTENAAAEARAWLSS